MRFYKFLAAGLCLASMSLFSCGGDDNDNDIVTPDQPGTPENPGSNTGTGDIKVYTPTESKEFLSNTAKDFLNTFRAADQSEVIRFCNEAIDEYGDLDMPSNFDIDEETGNRSFAPGVFLKDLMHGLDNANPARINSAAMVYTYNINFPRFTGVYTPGKYSWIKKAESNDIVFEFSVDGKDCVIRAQAEGGNSDINVDINGEEWYYDYETGQYDEEEYTDRYNISVPRTVKLSVTKGGTQLLTSTINTNINVKGHVLAWDVYTKVANIEVASKGNGVDTNITENTSLTVGGKTLISTKSQINGNNLCNKDKLTSVFEDEDDDYAILAIISNAISQIDVMGQVQFYGSVSFNRGLLDALDSYWDCWDYTNKSEAEYDCKKACETLNKNISTRVSYLNTQTKQAEVTFKPELDEWYYGNYWEYYTTPMLYFPADGTTYTFEEYTRKGFASVEDLWDAQIDNYERLWK